jgi:hypothetical protein
VANTMFLALLKTNQNYLKILPGALKILQVVPCNIPGMMLSIHVLSA